MHNIKELKKIFNNKKVFMTGHTGFKGSYMCVLLKYLGAKVYGYSLKPEKDGLYELLTSGVKYSVGGDFNVSCLSQKGLETFMQSSVALARQVHSNCYQSPANSKEKNNETTYEKIISKSTYSFNAML